MVAATALAAIGIFLLQTVQNRRKAAQREQRYQMVLASYAANLKPGMNRDKVEHYLHSNGIEFRQMCCVSEHASLIGSGWDDLVKIDEQPLAWVCKANNVYIAFEFSPKTQGEPPDTNDSDSLKRVGIFHQLEGCL